MVYEPTPLCTKHTHTPVTFLIQCSFGDARQIAAILQPAPGRCLRVCSLLITLRYVRSPALALQACPQSLLQPSCAADLLACGPYMGISFLMPDSLWTLGGSRLHDRTVLFAKRENVIVLKSALICASMQTGMVQSNKWLWLGKARVVPSLQSSLSRPTATKQISRHEWDWSDGGKGVG